MADSKELKVRAEEWKEFVRKDMIGLLDKFLDISERAASNILYINPIKAKFETHTDYDADKAAGVQLTFVLRFEDVIDLTEEKE